MHIWPRVFSCSGACLLSVVAHGDDSPDNSLLGVVHDHLLPADRGKGHSGNSGRPVVTGWRLYPSTLAVISIAGATVAERLVQMKGPTKAATKDPISKVDYW